MILKGASRSNVNYWSHHLLRTDHNEQVDILEVPPGHAETGAGLYEALRQFQDMATLTKGAKGLYCLHIDPDGRYAMQGEDWRNVLGIATEELGYENQPRLVVKHTKDGREHIHAVMQRARYDERRGQWTLIPDGWNYKAHELAARRMDQRGHLNRKLRFDLCCRCSPRMQPPSRYTSSMKYMPFGTTCLQGSREIWAKVS